MIDPPTTHTITVNAAEQDHLIDSVTVFQADRAEVKRRVQLLLKKGQNQINIERLPTCLSEDSLRVQGTGTAIIFDVVYHTPASKSRYNYMQVDNDSSDEEDEEETKHYNAMESLKKQRTVVDNQIVLLDEYGHSVVDVQKSSMEDVERFLDLYGSRRDALDKRVQEINSEIIRVEKVLQAAKKHKSSNKTKGRRQTKVTVTVISQEEGKAELMLSYVVRDASWTPIYEIRASVSSSPNSPSTIAIHYRASLTQATGEDWPEVALTLSTATPYRGTSIPTLSTWRIGIPSRGRDRSWSPPKTHVIHAAGRGRSRSHSPTRIIHIDNTSRHARSRSSSHSPTRIIQVGGSPGYQHPQVIRAGTPTRYEKDRPAAMIFRQADGIDIGVLSATFNIPGRSNIPSDQGKHKVLIASLDFQVDPEWVCIPRKDASVFLRCKIVNSSEFTFLPGEASVFIGDSFVSKSQIQHVPSNDSFQLSLGVDPALRVTYPFVHTHKRTRSQPGFTFPGRQKQPKQATTKYSQQVTIRNTRATAVPDLHILDHVPVSNDSTVRVKVTSPQGLRDNNRPTEDETVEKEKRDETWVHPQKGVQARWAPPDMGGEGAIEWVCAIGAGEEIELKLGWEVSASEETSWRNL
ncbi:mucoidy inhibitor A, putative [Rhizoctonia solani AG-3 Rhs1AP]|uniref:Mucoidy inhibitor A, putative n=2 Tax=Rhizoctonia solani AG-3 TaxID=1086053 RepID=X8JNF1_9AGAM|nr:mucoidy inhibitor A, putative [Rhizoctonia solani AG-3 Rhs1AP]KEP55807.1 putative mucoidy inhibitor A [Rhizoctonia solani 123E]